MGEIVFDEEPQGDWRIVAHNARCLKAVFADAVHDSGKYFVLYLPPAQQCLPRLSGISVRGHPGVLRIVWARIAGLCRSAHEALAVVGCGIQEVP